jgi:hypothetical protein
MYIYCNISGPTQFKEGEEVGWAQTGHHKGPRPARPNPRPYYTRVVRDGHDRGWERALTARV